MHVLLSPFVLMSDFSPDDYTAMAGLFDVKLVFLAFVNWIVEGTFKGHSVRLIQPRSQGSKAS